MEQVDRSPRANQQNSKKGSKMPRPEHGQPHQRTETRRTNSEAIENAKIDHHTSKHHHKNYWQSIIFSVTTRIRNLWLNTTGTRTMSTWKLADIFSTDSRYSLSVNCTVWRVFCPAVFMQKSVQHIHDIKNHRK